MKDFSSIVKLIKKGKFNSSIDQVTFKRYVENMIDIKECIETFKFNNGISDDVKIDETLFEEWIKTLGYSRG